MSQELLFDLIESEANVNIFLDKENFTAKGAGIIITSSSVGHFPKRRGDKYTVWFGSGVARFTFSKFNDACLKVIEILKSGDRPVPPRVEGRDSKKFLKIYNKEMQSSG